MSAPGGLPTLPSVSKISNHVTRILGQNPGKFTLQGTNTYLIHHPSSPSLILLDTAQGVPSYLPLLRGSIQSHPVQPCHLTDIILSHYHLDHTDGLRSVLAELGKIGAIGKNGVRVWKYKCSREDEDGKDADIERQLEGLDESLIDTDGMRYGESLTSDGSKGGKIRVLRNGQIFEIKSANESDDERVELEVVHTPGHTSDSISLLLRDGSGCRGDSASSATTTKDHAALFSFDTVLGHGTAVFSSLSTYLESLTSLISLLSPTSDASGTKAQDAAVPIYPGHGAVIEDGIAKLKEYKQHRLDRESQVIEALKGRRSELVTATSLTNSIYGNSIPESLKPAATRGLLLHLEKLVLDGRVSRHDQAKEDTADTPVDWDKLGVSAKDIPAGWDDKWSWVGSD
ncbi:hypothetical protein JCM3766R1_003170 [Sporobolomyces carnicolor]